MPFNLEATDIIVIVIVAIILFGPSKLPEIGRGLGKAIVEFRNGVRGMSDGFREEMNPHETGPAAQPSAPVQPVQAPPPDGARGNFCTQCGAPNPVGSQFCNQCGQAILTVK
jgi:sec-independent protein translocase protein TatA